MPLLQRPQQATDDAGWAAVSWPRQRDAMRRLRAARRGALALGWTALAMIVQSVLILLPGTAKVWFSRFYWRVVCRLIGLNVRVIGSVAEGTDGRPVVFVSNHSSWLDIPVLGSRLDACFVAKEEVGSWPVIRTVARLGRTVYVRRNRSSLGRERDDMAQRLKADNLVLFPEGTTSDGSRVLPFRSAFLSIAEQKATPSGRTPLIQPVSVVYDQLAGLPTGRAARPLFAWYGDMEIGPHFWVLAQHKGLRCTMLLHPPLDPERFDGRKSLAAAAFTVVADGCATLRQNRPAFAS